MMKKSLLALAVAALSANAFATDVDYTVANPVVNTIATELSIPADNRIITADTLTWDLGFSITANTQRYIRITLGGGATFTNAPTLTVDGVAAQLSQGGNNTSNFAIFEVSPAANVASDANVVLSLNNLTITGKNSISAAYSLYETAVDAVNQTNQLAGKAAAPYVNFSSGLLSKVEMLGTQRVIDVAATPTATRFIFGNTAQIGGVAIDAVPGLVTYNTAVPATLASLVANGTSLVVSGDFSAGVKNANGVPVPATVQLGGTPATTITTTSATFVLNEASVGTPSGANPIYVPIFYTVSGNTAIPPATYTGVYDVVSDAAANTADVNLGELSTLTKNGATADVEMALTPGGVYSNFVRITNLSNITGNVFVTIYNDEGKSVSFPLSAVGVNAALEAQGSTKLIPIGDFYAAAQAADPSFAVASGRDKLRLVIDGEFTNIDAQAVTVSKDGNSFATF